MQLPLKIETGIPETEFDKSLLRGLFYYTSILSRILNDGITFEDNFNAQIIDVSLGGADVESAIAHTLSRIPIGYLVTSRTAGGVVYNGSSAWTTTTIYLRSTIANNTIKIVVF